MPLIIRHGLYGEDLPLSRDEPADFANIACALPATLYAPMIGAINNTSEATVITAANTLYLLPPNRHISNMAVTMINIQQNSVINIETYHNKLVGALNTVRSESRKSIMAISSRSIEKLLANASKICQRKVDAVCDVMPR
jgi:hypothetical protein